MPQRSEQLGAASGSAAMHQDMTLIVTENFDNAKRNAIHKAVAALGGHVSLIYPPNVMVARIPAAANAGVARIPGVKLVSSTPVDATQLGIAERNALAGVGYFNWVVTGKMAEELERVKDIIVDINSLAEHGLPGGGGSGLISESGLSVTAAPDMLSLNRAEPQTHTIYPNDVLDSLTAIDVFFLESIDDPATPQTNENEFTWTVQHHNDHANRISEGFRWWIDVAASRGIYLTYVLRFFPGSDWQQQVPFEPIRRAVATENENDFDWVSRVTANHGVTAGNTSRSRTRAYGDSIRAFFGAKNGFCVFAPYNPDPAPTTHPDGYGAFGWYGDYVHLCYRAGGYPVEQNPRVFAHEMGHVFWACDEYFQECQRYASCTNCYGFVSGDPDAAANGPGPREPSMNWNCELCTPGGPAACVMYYLTNDVWTNHLTCEHTRRMIGWPN